MSSLNLDKYKKQRKKKPKDAVKKFKGGGFKIVDEDLGFDHNLDDSDDETAEELPQIASVVDERPREMQYEEELRKGKWKTLTILEENRQRNDSDQDNSPRGKERHDSSEGDLSPPRPSKVINHSGGSSQRKRHDSGDMSPPRQRKASDSRSVQLRRLDSDEDISPPRQRKRADSDGDLSPPRQRRRRDSDDLSPPRMRQNSRHRGDQDLSPPRSSVSRSGSPPRRPKQHQSRRPIANPQIIEEPSNSYSGTTLEGKKAGLQRAADLRKEMVDYRKKENALFENLDDEVSGRNAVTKQRDRTTGRERDLVAEIAKKEEEDRVAAERKKLYDKWGKGLKQVEQQSTRLNEALHEISKPLARYADDEDLDEYMKNQVRDGDPMLKFLTSKKKTDISRSDKPAYQGPLPLPNRFGVNPGHRWDGVDRANGYEKEWFSRINTKKAFTEEAYKWSVEDL